MPLPTASELYNQALTALQGYGNADQAALQQSYQNAMGQGMQQLASSGLANTSVAPSMRMGYMAQYQKNLNALGQQMQQAKLGAMQNFGLGGIQSEQAQQGLDLSKGNLALNQQYAELAKQNQQFQQGMQRDQFGFQQSQYNNALSQNAQQMNPASNAFMDSVNSNRGYQMAYQNYSPNSQFQLGSYNQMFG